jgi:hypothetical protein
LIEIDVNGRLRFAPLWEGNTVWEGLQPGQTETSDILVQTQAFGERDSETGTLGLGEIRLFAAPYRMQTLLAPPSLASRNVQEVMSPRIDTRQIKVRRIRYRVSGLPKVV